MNPTIKDGDLLQERLPVSQHWRDTSQQITLRKAESKARSRKWYAEYREVD